MSPLLKLLQRRLYSFLGTWSGCLLVLLGVYSLLFFALSATFPSSPSSTSSNRLRSGSGKQFWAKHDYADNIANQDLEDYLSFGPIDVVYSWVNGSDPIWARKKQHYMRKTLFNMSTNSNISMDVVNNDTQDTEIVIPSTASNAMSDNRYRDSEELRYSLRSLVKFAPWIRKIFIVTDNQIPYWLNLDLPGNKIEVVPHSAIFPHSSHLPVFSSPAIEAHLHRIPGLSKKFIYFNDDVFLGAPVYPEDFYSPARHTQRLYMAWDVPKCAPGCSDSWIGDGYCDKACNVSACNFDYPDCVNGTTGRGGSKSGYTSRSEDRFFCSQGCPNTWLGDKVCDNKCRNAACGWDMGDCGVSLVAEDFKGTTFLLPSRPSENSTIDAKEVVSSKALEVEKTLSQNSSFPSGPRNITVKLRSANGPHVLRRYENSIQTQDDDSMSVPIALTVEYGHMGVYFNLSYIPCESLSLDLSNLDETSPYNTSAIYSPSCSPGKILDPFSVPSVGYSRVVNRGQPVAWSNFSYSSVTYEIFNSSSNTLVDNDWNENVGDLDRKFVHPSEVLTSLALVQKHHMLIVLLYGHEDFFENPSINTKSPSYIPPAQRELLHPVDVLVTVKGYNFQSRINVTARFTLRIVPKQKPDPRGGGDTSNSTIIPEEERPIPSHMSQVHHENASIAQCLDVRDIRELEQAYLAESDEQRKREVVLPVDIFRISQVRVMPQPFSLPRGDERFSSSNVAFISPSSLHRNHMSQPMNASTALDTKLSPRNGYNYTPYREGVVFSLSFLPGSLPATSPLLRMPLHRLVVRVTVTINDGNRSTFTGSLCEVLAIQTSTDRIAPMFASRVDSSGRSRALLSSCLNTSHAKELELNVLSVIHPNNSQSSSSHYDLLMMVPMPLDWKEASFHYHPLKVYSKVEMFAELHNDNSTAEHEEHTLDVNSQAILDKRHRVGCVGGSLLWGDVLSDTSNSTNGTNSSLHPFPLNASASNSSVLGNSSASSSSASEEPEVDTYAMSLIHVNKLYHDAFGAENRKVPAHMPHLIDKDIMEEMQLKWKKEWAETSSHRFRSTKDMQYAFSYYYYVAHRNKANPPDLRKFLEQEVDTDGDGYLSDNEFLTLAVIVFQHNPSTREINELLNCTFGNSTRNETDTKAIKTSVVSNKSQVSKKTQYGVFTETVLREVRRFPNLLDVLQCPLAVDNLRKHVPWSPTHVFESDKEVSFEMIGDNATEVRTQLNGIRARKNKFVCVNDQMKHPSEEIKQLLRDFYLSYFPHPSQFERSPDHPNEVLHLDEYLALKSSSAAQRGPTGCVAGWQCVRVQASEVARSVMQSLSTAWTSTRRVARLEAISWCHWVRRRLLGLSSWLEGRQEEVDKPAALRRGDIAELWAEERRGAHNDSGSAALRVELIVSSSVTCLAFALLVGFCLLRLRWKRNGNGSLLGGDGDSALQDTSQQSSGLTLEDPHMLQYRSTRNEALVKDGDAVSEDSVSSLGMGGYDESAIALPHSPEKSSLARKFGKGKKKGKGREKQQAVMHSERKSLASIVKEKWRKSN